MTPTKLLRWSALLFLPAGVLLALYFLLHARAPGGGPPTATEVLNSPYALEGSLGVSALVLTQLGLIGIYAYLAEASRRVALTGFVLALVGNVLVTCLLFYDAYVVPILAASAPKLIDPVATPFNDPIVVVQSLIPWVVFALGFILLGVAALRRGGTAGWAGIPLMIGALLLGLPLEGPWLVFVVGGVLLGLGQAWLGYIIWSARNTAAEQRVPVL
jgi:hypothetical protein